MDTPSESKPRRRVAGPWVVLGMILLVAAAGFAIWWATQEEKPATKPAVPAVEGR